MIKVQNLTKDYRHLRASGFQDEPVEIDWKNPDIILDIHSLSGSEYVCRFITKDDKQVYAKQDDSDQVYIVSTYLVERFKKKYLDYQKTQ